MAFFRPVPGVRYGAYNYLTGVPEAACALDIAGAIAWMTQIATFVQQLGPQLLGDFAAMFHHR